MKFVTVVALLVLSAMLITFGTSAQNGRTPPDERVLGVEAKLGTIKFNHRDHITKNRSIEGGTIACIECHHTAQPASEVVKTPPLKTAWPADRTTTLTAELLAKDPNPLGGATCHSCHTRMGTKPDVWPEIPQIKHESSTAMITLTNQQAFHRNCAGCHDEVVKHRKDVNPPTSMKCTSCHKK